MRAEHGWGWTVLQWWGETRAGEGRGVSNGGRWGQEKGTVKWWSAKRRGS